LARRPNAARTFGPPSRAPKVPKSIFRTRCGSACLPQELHFRCLFGLTVNLSKSFPYFHKRVSYGADSALLPPPPYNSNPKLRYRQEVCPKKIKFFYFFALCGLAGALLVLYSNIITRFIFKGKGLCEQIRCKNRPMESIAAMPCLCC
jgi:hypothetical protein